MRKVNLGCGTDVLDGWENYDFFPHDDRVKKLDLNILPLPFEDNSIDEIKLCNVLEHLSVHPFEFMQDCHRILKKDGLLHLTLPSFVPSITHLRCLHTVDYLNPVIMTKDRTLFDGYHYRGVFKQEKVERHFKVKQFLWNMRKVIYALGGADISWRLRK